MEDTVVDLGVTSVARHREPRSHHQAMCPPMKPNVCTPRPTSSRVTTA